MGVGVRKFATQKLRTFPFGQPPGSYECGHRCAYAVVHHFGKTGLTYAAFRERQWHAAGKGPMGHAALYRVLTDYGMKFGPSFPTPYGLYLVMYPVATRPGWHVVVYHDQVVYDCDDVGPYRVPIRSFIQGVRPKGTPVPERGLVCVEVFGTDRSYRAWKRSRSNSKLERTTTTSPGCLAEFSSAAGFSTGGSTPKTTRTLWQWVRSISGLSRPASPDTSSQASRSS